MGREFVGPGLELVYRKAGGLPLVGGVLRRDYEERFANNRFGNLFRGVYASFAEAQASVPPTRPVGYDNTEAAAMYRDRTERVHPTDYPVLFWLDRLLPSVRRLFEFGGHVGVAYYAYRRYLRAPEGLQWTVCDVPAVVEAGRALARERGAEGLAFTTAPGEADGADLFFASGSLQYVEAPLAELLRPLARRPAHVVVNMTPLHPARTFVTLNSIGTAFCPYLVQGREAFVRGLEGLGYRLVDSWENPEKGCPIPFHPEHSLRGYTGMYLTLGQG
jgi:putative methyltransferase (TIGR04325 family)